MNRQPAAAVKIRLVIELLEDLCIKHADDEVIGLVGIRYHAEQRALCLAVPVHAGPQLRKL